MFIASFIFSGKLYYCKKKQKIYHNFPIAFISTTISWSILILESIPENENNTLFNYGWIPLLSLSLEGVLK